jgi:hypothetical protein
MVACVLILPIGCGGPGGPVDPQAQVSGSVTNNGKPITLDSHVVFYNKEKGLTLTGVIDSLGKYSLSAADPKVGVPVGRYEVTIKPPVPPVVEVNPSSPDYMKMMQASQGAKSVSATGKANSAPDIPEKFNDPKTSGLVFEVKQGVNTFDLDLSKL